KSLSVSPSAFTCANVGPNTVTLTVTDNNNNVATCTATVTVVDNTLPTAKCKAATVVLDVNGKGTLAAADVNEESSDACGIKSLSVSPSSFTCANAGPNTVTLTVTDNNNNVATCTATVTVVDNTLPTAKCKAATVVLDASGQATVNAADVDNGSSDNCAVTDFKIAKGTVLAGDPSLGASVTFGCGETGPRIVTLQVKDAAGSASTCQATVTVSDSTPPVITHCPANVNASTGPARTTCDALATWEPATATDNCGIAAIKYYTGYGTGSPAEVHSGAAFPKGTTTVTTEASDTAGNKITCTFTVTVTDNTPPTVNCPAVPPQSAYANATCSALVPDVCGLVRAQSSDNCTASSALSITQIPAKGTSVSGSGPHPIQITV